ncbi:diacylglycerol kinase family protein [Thermoactinomyces daqus]|uniref:Diacylglycerol kinase family protein n=1 Tax=Thermoactinomyces daqus TaxID=1329516 RepID=A0A7W1X9N6_9BACL|nr:diacylglycerol kinase family protein [Thermoactinomyces daqus]MBA4542629.1 diacylglycerol kinase family protein [Thermoactinomyces daqus]
MWVTKLLRSFVYALEGLKYTVITQRNMRIHFLIALAVLFFALYLPISKLEVLVVFITIILVLFAELINTAVEAVVDMVTEEYHPLAKIAKDVAAGAVLLTAGLAVIVGISVFYPYLDKLFIRLTAGTSYPANIGLAVIIVFDFFLTLLLKGWCHRVEKHTWEPSMTSSISLCISTLLILVTGNLHITFLVLLLLMMLVGMRLRYQPRRLSVVIGGILGIFVATIGLQLL